MNLKELAESLQLSPTTVSRALNGYPEVSAQTRARVEAAARAAEYAPNARARRLATGRIMAIGHVIPLSSDSESVNPIFAEFLAGAGEVYAREGYDLILSIVREDEEEQTYRRLARERSVDGVIVQSPRRNDSRIALLQSLGLPFLVHGRADDSSHYSWLDVENARAFRRATKFLIDLGHKDIALINAPERYDYTLRRYRGYCEALAQAGIALDQSLVSNGPMTEASAFEVARDFLTRPSRPTAILTASIMQAMGIRRAAWELGYDIPRDLSIICYDDALSYLSNSGEDAFTSARSSIRDAGKRCAEIIVSQLGAPKGPLVQEIWDVQLIIGGTTGPPPPQGSRS